MSENDFEVTIKLHCIPAKNRDELKEKICGILYEVGKLEFETDMKIEKVGEWP